MKPILSYFIASFMGVIFHFVYDWSGQNPFIRFFFPINESIWEHLKLIYFPILFVSLIEYFFFDTHTEKFFVNQFFSILVGMLSTVILFYTYSGVLGRNIDVINIIIYFISMALAYGFSHYAFRTDRFKNVPTWVGSIGLLLLYVLFVWFTINPPQIGLFAIP